MTADYQCIVAGDGPAGISAALTVAGLGFSTLLVAKLDPNAVMGTIGPVENLPGFPDGTTGADLMLQLKKQLDASRVTVRQGAVSLVYGDYRQRYVMTADGATLACSAVIVATGVTPQKLGVPGEDEFYMKGVYTCMYCDYRQAEGRRVGIVGGSDSACKAALFLNRYASQVYLMHKSGTLSGRRRREVEAEPGIEVLDRTGIHRLYGNGRLQGVEISTGGSWQKRKLPLDALFVYIGGKPDLSIFRDHVRTDRGGFLITDSSLMTTQKGIFAAGALRSGPVNQVINSLSDGVSAGLAAAAFLE